MEYEGHEQKRFCELSRRSRNRVLSRTGDGNVVRQQGQGVVFDGLTVFDPRPVAALTERIFPYAGKKLARFGGCDSLSTHGCGLWDASMSTSGK